MRREILCNYTPAPAFQKRSFYNNTLNSLIPESLPGKLICTRSAHGLNFAMPPTKGGETIDVVHPSSKIHKTLWWRRETECLRHRRYRWRALAGRGAESRARPHAQRRPIAAAGDDLSTSKSPPALFDFRPLSKSSTFSRKPVVHNNCR